MRIQGRHTPKGPAPDRDLLELTYTVENLAHRYQPVIAHLNTEIEASVWPSHETGDGSRSTNDDTPVERAARARAQLISQRDQIIDDRTALLALAESFAFTLRQGERMRAPSADKPAVRLCDGQTFEGAKLTWTPHSRQPDNGWHDPNCRDPADDSGLCAKCRIRERRWREENGLPPRTTNASIEAA